MTQTQPGSARVVQPPSDDKRWRTVNATMRKHGSSASGLIETLHTVQEAFGYLDAPALTYVARSLRVPLSKAYGVATFYSHFRLKPQGKHLCVVCMGTACYLQGGPKVLTAVEQCARIKSPETTPDNMITLAVRSCIGACGIAPAAVFDGEVIGNLAAVDAAAHIKEWLVDE